MDNLFTTLTSKSIYWNDFEIEQYRREFLYPWNRLICRMNKGEVKKKKADQEEFINQQIANVRLVLPTQSNVQQQKQSLSGIFRSISFRQKQEKLLDLQECLTAYKILFDILVEYGEHKEAASLFLQVAEHVEQYDNELFKIGQAKRDLLCAHLAQTVNWKKLLIGVYCASIWSSGAIEGYDSLSFEQICQLLKEGDNVSLGWASAAPERAKRQQMDSKAARNLSTAYAYMLECVGNAEHKINREFVTELHYLVYAGLMEPIEFEGILHNPAGFYEPQKRKYLDNFECVLNWIERMVQLGTNEPRQIVDPMAIATIGHFCVAYFHVFVDGNGRVARLFMDYLLLRFGYPPIHIPYENCNAYFDVINQTDKELRPFMRVLHNYLMETMNQLSLCIPTGAQKVEQIQPMAFSSSSGSSSTAKTVGTKTSEIVEQGRFGSSGGSVFSFPLSERRQLSPEKSVSSELQPGPSNFGGGLAGLFREAIADFNPELLKYELPPKPSDDALKLDNQEEEMTSGQAMAQLIQEAIREFNPKLLEYKKAENEDDN